MALNDTTVKFKADISNLRAGMQAAQRSVRLATTEFKAATAGMDNWANSEKGLEEKIKLLNTTLEANRKRASLARDEWEKTKQVFGENSAEADRAKMRLNAYEAEVASTEKQLKYFEGELEDCRQETGRFAKSTKEADDALDKMSDGFTVAKGVIADFVAAGIRYAISALKDLTTEIISVGIEFESSMSKVKAISGASSEEMDLLTEKAKEMGETTVFSASEASAAFQYMAMAGWKTEEMLDGIEGIMNLAAASGEDLATTSDIVTDALTAFGMEAKDAGRFADILAAAASNSNTNVSMMGESFKYIAPLAGSMGYSAEDVAKALGLMANAGIKSTQAGTSLRTLLTNMAKPTDTVAAAMDTLGLSLDDGAGNMKSLEEIMKDLRKGFGTLKMSASDFEKQSKLLDDQLSDGTITQEQYDKSLEELTKSAFGAEGALKAEAAASLAGARGLSGLLAIVNATETDFDSLSSAIDNSAGSAENMADIMTDNVGGQLTLLKSKIQGIMINLFEKASDTMRGGIERVSEALDNVDWDAVGEAVGRFAEKALDFFVWIIKNGDVILETLKSVAKVMITIFAVKKIVQFTSFLNNAITAFKGFVTAIKAGTTAFDAASSAGGIFASLVSPAGAIVLGLTAIVAVTASLVSIFGEEKEAIKVLTEEQEEHIRKSKEMADAYEDLETARQESMQSVTNEYDRYDDLLRELDSLVSANGRVTTGYEQRVAFILNELNSAFGTEMQLINGVVQGYQNERAEIEKVIDMKRAESMLAANESAYTEAYAKRAEAAGQYATAQNDFNDALAKAQEQQQKVNAVMDEYDRILTEKGIEAALDYKYANQEVIDQLEPLRQAVTETRSSLINATEAYEGYNRIVKNYEGLSSAIIEGDADKINSALLKTEHGLKDHTNTTADELKAQADRYRTAYEEIKRAVEEGNEQITQDQLDNAKKLADLTWSEYLLSGKDSVAGYKQGISDPRLLKQVEQDSAAIGETSLDGLHESLDENSPSKKTRESGVNFVQGFINGMSDKESEVYRRAYDIAQTAIQALKESQKEHSPSKVTFESGVNFVKGYVNGIASMTKKLENGVSASIKTVLSAVLKVTDGDFSKLGSSAADSFTSALSERLKYTLEKMQYQNTQKLAEYDDTISALTEKQNAEKDEALKKQYKEQIEEQQKAKKAYQTASQQMISEYTQAMNDYQKQAENLIKTTVNGIADKYQAEYDALVTKQNNLAAKLRGAESLFDISGAGVMTVNDITAQTKTIKGYTKKLNKIKSKVSSDLFDEIAGYDMKEGSAFIDRLLAMSDKELKAYSDAYDEKLRVSQSTAEKVYKKDLANTEKAYKAEMKQAFKGLPKELEELGAQAMKGFITGLTKNTDYMSDKIKTFVQSMVSEFKKDLKIKSPSRLMAEIGGFTGEGFIEGIRAKIKGVKEIAQTMASAVSAPVSEASRGMLGVGAGSQTINNYNLVQNNTSPKPLSALETFRARRRQVELVKALT